MYLKQRQRTEDSDTLADLRVRKLILHRSLDGFPVLCWCVELQRLQLGRVQPSECLRRTADRFELKALQFRCVCNESDE